MRKLRKRILLNNFSESKISHYFSVAGRRHPPDTVGKSVKQTNDFVSLVSWTILLRNSTAEHFDFAM